jgi:hypothetical protein
MLCISVFLRCRELRTKCVVEAECLVEAETKWAPLLAQRRRFDWGEGEGCVNVKECGVLQPAAPRTFV